MYDRDPARRWDKKMKRRGKRYFPEGKVTKPPPGRPRPIPNTNGRGDDTWEQGWDTPRAALHRGKRDWLTGKTRRA